MPLSKQALRVLNNTNFPNNNSQYISPELLREFNGEMITSMELTQSMSEYAVLEGGNAFIGSQSIDGYVSIDKTKALNTNGIYWNNNVVGYTNLEIVNSSPNGNVNIGAIGGKVQIVSSSLNITNGTFSASLENGYAWVGDGNNRTSLVPTSSFGSVTSAITASSLITASFSGNTLTFTKGDSSTFGVVIPDVSGSTIPTGTVSSSQQILNYNIFATTGSNVFVGEQIISSSLIVTNAIKGTGSLTLQPDINDVRVIGIYNTSATDTHITASGGNLFLGNDETYVLATTYANQKLVTIRGDQGISASGSLSISGSLTASLQQGYVWVGDGNNRTQLVPTSSFAGGSTNTGSLMVTGSVAGNVLTFTKGDSSQFSLTVATGSGGGGSTDTGSLLVTASFNTTTRNITFTKGDASQFNISGFATTGSNNFVGIQNFSASVEGNILNIVGSSKMTLGGNTMPFNETGFFNMVAGDGTNQGGALQFQVSNGGSTFVCNDAPSGSTQSVGNTPIAFENNTRSGSISFTNRGNTGQIRLQNNTGSINLAAGNSISISGSSTTIQDVNFIPFSASLNSRILAITGSSTNTGSLLVTASFNGNLKEITFTKGNTNQFVLGGFATTGSNIFRGSQQIETSSLFFVGSNEEFIKTEFNTLTLQNKTAVYVNYLAPATFFQSNGNFAFQNTVASAGSGSMSFLIQNGGGYTTTAEGGGNIGFTTSGSSGGNIGFITNTGSITSNITNGGSYSATVNGGGSISFTAGTGSISLSTPGEINLQGAVRIRQKDGSNAVTIVNSSGSLLYCPASFTSASLHLSQSSGTQNTSVNLVFKTNNNTADTIISGSSNIFTNPTAQTAGFKRYFGGSGNIAMSPATTPQISGSMGFSPTMNVNFFGGASGMIMRGPVSSSAWTISNNIINNNSAYSIGTSATLNAEKIVSGLNMLNNAGSVVPLIQAYKTPLSASVVFSTNSGTGQISMLCDSSSIVVSSNTFGGGTTINNSYFPATVNSSANINLANNNIFGTTIVNASGSDTTFTGVQPRGVYNSIVGGYSTIGLVLNGDNAAVNSSAIIGGGLVVTGSNSKVAGATANGDYGSAFFGRWNAQDGNRAISGPTVFAVGAGTSTSARKTAFLIDSGSNTFIEGTLNVSGSTQFTGSISIAPTFEAKFATGSNQQAGTAVLDGANPGTVVVSNSLVTANSIIMLTKQTNNHPNAGPVVVSSKGAGTFTITSNHNGDADTVGWFIINNS